MNATLHRSRERQLPELLSLVARKSPAEVAWKRAVGELCPSLHRTSFERLKLTSSTVNGRTTLDRKPNWKRIFCGPRKPVLSTTSTFLYSLLNFPLLASVGRWTSIFSPQTLHRLFFQRSHSFLADVAPFLRYSSSRD